MKRCPRCNTTKSKSDFYLRSDGRYLRSWCKECEKSYGKDKRKDDRSYEWFLPGTSDAEKRKRSKLRNLYGLTLEELQDMLEAQEHQCATCETQLVLTPWGEKPNKQTPQVDHDHITHKVRGLLCRPCNTALGLVADSPRTLERMVLYVRNN